MTTLVEVKQILLRLLGDTEQVTGGVLEGTSYSADLLKDAIHRAMDAILPKVAKRSVAAVTSGSTVFALPTTVYRIEGIQLATTGGFLSKLTMEPNAYFGDSGTDTFFVEYPQGSITFSRALTEAANVYHLQHWAKPAAETDALESPEQALSAIVMYATSWLLFPNAVSAGDLGQYKRKVDAGQPTDNPLIDLSNFFMTRFDIEMSRLPMMEAGRL